MCRYVALIGCLVLLALLALPGSIAAQPQVCGFYGSVQLSGVNVPDGTIVKAWIGSVEVKSTTTVNSLYNMYIEGELEVELGIYDGKIVTFTVGEKQYGAIQSVPWQRGGNLNINLEAFPLRSVQISPSEGVAAILTGEGFPKNSEIDFTWQDEILATVPHPVTTDSVGRFSALVVAPTTDPGDYVIKASDAGGNTAEASFKVISLKGAQGEVGPSGKDGAMGTDGRDGLDGLDGTNGLTGPAGEKGEKGEKASAAGIVIAVIIAIIALVISIAIAVFWQMDRKRFGREIRQKFM
ncbi:MAG: hypothetical protein PHV74_00970 [Dehalococcoidia bacterium]|nr:hypothetical protein [Dehalococcoidia bacterium]